jgi:hypothetical protein
MLVATFGPSAEWAGKTISHENGRFTLEDFGPITPQAVLEYDRQGQLLWASDGTRAWVHGLTVTTRAPTAVVATKKGLSKGVRIVLAIGIVLVVAVVIAASVLNADHTTSTSSDDSVSSSEMHQRLAREMRTVVDACRVSDGHADVRLKDSGPSEPRDYLAAAQQDCFDAFRVVFAPDSGVTTATVEVMVERSDQFGYAVWDPVYKASMSGEDAAKVDWEAASPQELATLWTVDYRKEYMAP